jgi:hypothetical protein
MHELLGSNAGALQVSADSVGVVPHDASEPHQYAQRVEGPGDGL